MKLPPLNIGDLTAKIPIIQGGMGVGVSRSRLASAVANEGAVGVISGVQLGFNESDFEINPREANLRALKHQISTARELSPKGIIGINFMVAMNNYEEMVLEAVRNKIDLIISGAGLPMNLPGLIKDTKTKIAPIVSSGKAAAIIAKLWDRRFNYAPDMVVVEGPEAGGHLGFSMEQLKTDLKPKLSEIVRDVKGVLKAFEDKYGKKIPVVAAGGIYTGQDIAENIQNGASGVQMASRFVATYECDAADAYKQAYINSKKEDIQIIKSPVGLPGRAIRNKFIEAVENGKLPVKRCYNCLKHCDPAETPYCISRALIDAVNGNIDEGLIFTGSMSYVIDRMMSVKQLIKELVAEAESYAAFA